MVDKPLDTYIKTPPPTNPNSINTYLEQQLGSIEKVLQKHTTTIQNNYANNNASITTEQGVRATADSALAYSLQQLTATVNANNTSTQGQITNLQTAAADAATATATQLQTLSAKVDTNLGSTNAAISNEQKARATADSALSSKISTLSSTIDFNSSKLAASITDEITTRVAADLAEATKRSNLSSFVGYTDGQSYTTTLAASINNEQTARVAADTAIAQSVTSTSAGSSRVYTQSSAPSSSGRQTGDIWYDTSNNFTPYVWYSGSWQNNSTGAYSQYAGNNATVTTFQQAYLDPTNGLGYQWGVYGTKGTAADGVTPAIILTGGNRVNPTTGTYDTAVNKLVINANTEINGNLIVSGTVAAARIATIPGSKIATGNTDGIQTANLVDYAVTNSAGATASATYVGVSISLKAGDRVSVLCSCGPGPSSGGAYSGTLQAYVYPSSSPIGSVGITSMVESVVSVGGTLAASSKAPPASLLCFYTAPSAGSYYIYTVNAYASSISIMVVGLSK